MCLCGLQQTCLCLRPHSLFGKYKLIIKDVSQCRGGRRELFSVAIIGGIWIGGTMRAAVVSNKPRDESNWLVNTWALIC